MVAFVSVLYFLSLSASATEFKGGYSGVVATNLPYHSTKILVNGPNRLHIESVNFTIATDTGLPDGSYAYEVIGQLPKGSETIISSADDLLNNGREENARPKQSPTGVIEYGYFRIADGVVVTGNREE